MVGKEFSFAFFKNDKKIVEKNYRNEDSANTIFRFSLFDSAMIIDIEKQLFIRENDEYLFTLHINNKTCEIHLKKENATMPIFVDYSDLIIEENKYIIAYSIESEDAPIKMIITNKGE